MLVVDAANVIGSRPTGWWRDRAGATRGFVDRVAAAVATGHLEPPVVVVVEGAARAGASAGPIGTGVTVLHADGSGDDAIVALVAATAAPARVVTADRALRTRVATLGAHAVGPRWLWDRLDRAASAEGDG